MLGKNEQTGLADYVCSDDSLLGFRRGLRCFHGFHGFAAAYEVARGAAAGVCHRHDEAALTTLVLLSFLGHDVPPPCSAV